MKNENTSVGDANIGNAHEHEQYCMSDEQAKLALSIITRTDQRFAGMGENECNIAQGIAISNLVTECSVKGVDSFADRFEAHVRTIKRNALEDRVRKVTARTKNKKTGKIEYAPRKNNDSETIIGETVSQVLSPIENLEVNEREKQLHALFSTVKVFVETEMVVDELSKKAFALYIAGRSYNEIGCTVYGRNGGTQKQMTNGVSTALHKISKKIRKVYGCEAHNILNPVRLTYERYI